MATDLHREPWNKGIIVGQKAPLRLKEVWAVRMRLQLAHRARELALFNLGVDSKLRACDLVQLRVRDIRSPRVRHSPLDQGVGATFRRLAICGSHRRCAPLDASIREDCSSSDRGTRSRRFRVWNSLYWKDESIADLQTDKESSSCPAAVRSYEARKYGPLSRYRSGRRAGNGRAD